jgi:hypothetical protein
MVPVRRLLTIRRRDQPTAFDCYTAGLGFTRIPLGSNTFEPFVNVARSGTGLIGSPGSLVTWTTRTTADVWDETVYICGPYATGWGTRNWATW